MTRPILTLLLHAGPALATATATVVVLTAGAAAWQVSPATSAAVGTAGASSDAPSGADVAEATATVTERELVSGVTAAGLVRAAAGVTVRRGYTTAIDIASAASPTGAAAGAAALGGTALAASTTATGEATASAATSSTTPGSSATPPPSEESATTSTSPSSTSESSTSELPTTAPPTTASPTTASPTTGPSVTGPSATAPPEGPPPAGGPAGSGVPDEAGGQAGGGPPTGTTGQPLGGQGAGGAGGASAAGAAGQAVAPAAPRTETLTAVAAAGTAVGTGTVLYSADGQPVVAIVSDQVLWRSLDVDSDDGTDVVVLEQALVDLGYGATVTVDASFDSDTAAAVEEWERDLGRDDPDGVVALDDLVTVPAGVSVTAVGARPGDAIGKGSEILDLAAGGQEIAVDVRADETGPWRDGTVSIELSDGTLRAATVTSIGTDVTDPAEGATRGTVEVVVTTADAAGDLTTGTAVEVTAVVESAPSALTVPVSALVDHDGEPALRVVGRGTVPVTYGLVVDGLVEVLGAVTAGDVVLVPGAA